MWVEFVVGSLLCSQRFFCGYYGFPLSSKTNISKFQFDQESGRRRTTLWMCYLQIFIIIISVISGQFLSISRTHLYNLLKKMRERMLKMAPSFLSSPVRSRLAYKQTLRLHSRLGRERVQREFVLPPPPYLRPSRIEDRKIQSQAKRNLLITRIPIAHVCPTGQILSPLPYIYLQGLAYCRSLITGLNSIVRDRCR